ncbi:PREDICTED: uncharacterized protein LOC104800897 [Tarenaya hassleriana]|uniref:uncharacterized protein LOC104800897 n=1 Tax=Tarenaya hassleriana TaxID=28532 RepID=UPI00053C2B5C|nr:PREDICTED: uncharacterized protein LOC104800897 [Tarenaya hassleriana]
MFDFPREMLMDRERRFFGLNGIHDYSYGKFRDENGYGIADRSDGYREWSPSGSSASKMSWILSPSSSPPPSTSSPPLPSSSSSSSSPGAGYIEHRVSKFDTLSGIAIKYGVEVADIKKMNGLVTDLQMFALKTLRIPLPGRHPPSPCLSNGSSNPGEGSYEQASPCHEQTSSLCDNQGLFDSFQSLRLKSSDRRKFSAAMSSLQGYYGLKHAEGTVSEGLEMAAVHKKEASRLLKDDDDGHLRPSPSTNPPQNYHRKSKSLVNALLAEMGDAETNSDKWNEKKLMKRRQKSEADFTTSQTPETVLKEDSSSSSSSGGFSAISGKGVALRSKTSSRSNLLTDHEKGTVNLMDGDAGERFYGVRKSTSALSLREQDSNNGSSLQWPTGKWGMKTEMLRPAAIFDGLPMPLTGRRNKAAVD